MEISHRRFDHVPKSPPLVDRGTEVCSTLTSTRHIRDLPNQTRAPRTYHAFNAAQQKCCGAQIHRYNRSIDEEEFPTDWRGVSLPSLIADGQRSYPIASRQATKAC